MPDWPDNVNAPACLPKKVGMLVVCIFLHLLALKVVMRRDR